jgi:hypothetical protein
MAHSATGDRDHDFTGLRLKRREFVLLQSLTRGN